MKDRAILHSDANCFYASVETVLDPSLRDKAVAVCGSTDERHGIVLAKSERAKRAGVKTGMANWQAQSVCRDLIIVPPQYEYYLKFSRYLHKIYKRYTDLVEPFGMDECWLDVTHSPGNAMEIAEEIRASVKDELGLTVSIGVSFNKVFAKLGSDMKKPDAITEITKDNFKEKVWPLKCSELLYCGRSTTARLGRTGIYTMGEYGNVSPFEQCTRGDKRLKELLKLFVRNQEDLDGTLTDKQKEILEKFEDCMNEMHSITERDAFSYGFRLGEQLMAESFLLLLGEDE